MTKKYPSNQQNANNGSSTQDDIKQILKKSEQRVREFFERYEWHTGGRSTEPAKKAKNDRGRRK